MAISGVVSLESIKEKQKEVEHSGEEPWHALRDGSIPIRLDAKVLGITRSMDRDRVGEIAKMYGVDPARIKAQTEILEKNASYSHLVNTVASGLAIWKDNTYPWPERCVRLARKDWVDTFIEEVGPISEEVKKLAKEFDENHYPKMREQAKEDLKELYDPELYPEHVDERFSLIPSFPNLDTSSFVRKFHPELCKKEEERVIEQFKTAVSLSNAAFLGEFEMLVDKFLGMMQPGKRFMSCNLDKFRDFIGWFGHMDVGGNKDFSNLVAKVDSVLDGATPEGIRSDPELKSVISEEISRVKSSLSDMIEDKPSRSIRLED